MGQPGLWPWWSTPVPGNTAQGIRCGSARSNRKTLPAPSIAIFSPHGLEAALPSVALSISAMAALPFYRPTQVSDRSSLIAPHGSGLPKCLYENSDMKRVLSLSTLYPALGRTGFGRFVARQMEAIAARGDWQVTVINPIGMPPLPLKHYTPLRAIPALEANGTLGIHHPRFTLIPGLSGPINPALIARAVMPLARKLHAETPFNLVDAQFFYPDGPAAATIARALDLPLAIKARGSDIHLWGNNALARWQMLRAARQAKALLAVSRALAADMGAMGMPEDLIHVHYTGLDRERFQPLERTAARQVVSAIPALHIRPTGPLLLCVGALVPIKGQARGPDAPACRAIASLLANCRSGRFPGRHEAAAVTFSQIRIGAAHTLDRAVGPTKMPSVIAAVKPKITSGPSSSSATSVISSDPKSPPCG
jgi:hypothetical protein